MWSKLLMWLKMISLDIKFLFRTWSASPRTPLSNLVSVTQADTIMTIRNFWNRVMVQLGYTCQIWKGGAGGRSFDFVKLEPTFLLKVDLCTFGYIVMTHDGTHAISMNSLNLFICCHWEGCHWHNTSCFASRCERWQNFVNRVRCKTFDHQLDLFEKFSQLHGKAIITSFWCKNCKVILRLDENFREGLRIAAILLLLTARLVCQP